MPQIQLPIFPDGATDISSNLAFEKRSGRVTYFHGVFPVFAHDEADVRTFRMITSQFCVQGSTYRSDGTRAVFTETRTPTQSEIAEVTRRVQGRVDTHAF